jgi:hypothetical protein
MKIKQIEVQEIGLGSKAVNRKKRKEELEREVRIN